MSRSPSFREPDVLNRAMLLFWHQGFHATGIKQLERETNLRASSLYHRFGDKEGLYAATLEHYTETVVQRRIREHLETGDPLEGLRGFLHSSWNYIDEHRPPMACFLANSALELGQDHPRLRTRMADGMARVERALMRTLDRAQQQGRIVEDADIPALARRLVLGLQGLLVSTRAYPDRQWLEESAEMLLSDLPTTERRPQA